LADTVPSIRIVCVAAIKTAPPPAPPPLESPLRAPPPPDPPIS
jgi:hypothetical protein